MISNTNKSPSHSHIILVLTKSKLRTEFNGVIDNNKYIDLKIEKNV